MPNNNKEWIVNKLWGKVAKEKQLNEEPPVVKWKPLDVEQQVYPQEQFRFRPIEPGKWINLDDMAVNYNNLIYNNKIVAEPNLAQPPKLPRPGVGVKRWCIPKIAVKLMKEGEVCEEGKHCGCFEDDGADVCCFCDCTRAEINRGHEFETDDDGSWEEHDA